VVTQFLSAPTPNKAASSTAVRAGNSRNAAGLSGSHRFFDPHESRNRLESGVR
jgi:hypothetical protein